MRLACALGTILLATAAAGQSQTVKSGTGTAPPDFSGIWQVINTANWDLQGHPASASPVVALGAVGAVPGGQGVVEGEEIPYKPEALTKKQANLAHRLELDPEVKCYLPGVPRATYMPFPFQIVQTRAAIFIAYEYANATRTIYMKDPGPAPVDSWMGQSVGHWEGKALVVDSRGFNDESWFDRAGNYHSDALHVIERFTLRGHDAIQYEATIEDPNVFTRPWKISMPIYRRLDKDVQLVEFKCVEFVEELLYGQYRKRPEK